MSSIIPTSGTTSASNPVECIQTTKPLNTLKGKQKQIQSALNEALIFKISNVATLVVEYSAGPGSYFEEVIPNAVRWCGDPKSAHEIRSYCDLLCQFASPFVEWLAKQSTETNQQFDVCTSLLWGGTQIQGGLSKGPMIASVAKIAFVVVTNRFMKLMKNTPLQRAISMRAACQHIVLTKDALVKKYQQEEAEIKVIITYQSMSKRLQNIIRNGEWTPPQGLTESTFASAEAASFFMQVGGIYTALGSATQSDGPITDEQLLAPDIMELRLSKLRKLVDDVIKQSPPSAKKGHRQLLLSFLYETHMLVRQIKAVTLSCRADDQWTAIFSENTPLRKIMFSEDPFPGSLCPELITLRKALVEYTKRKTKVQSTFDRNLSESMELTQLVSKPYFDFQANITERKSIYTFLQAMLKKQEELLDVPEWNLYCQHAKTTPLPTPEEFSIFCTPPCSIQEIKADLKQLKNSYLNQPDAHSSFAAEIPKRIETQNGNGKTKHKNDAFAYLLKQPENSDKEIAEKLDSAPQKEANEAVLSDIFANRRFNLGALKYAPRVLKRLKSPKVGPGAHREDAWAHGFTTQLDRFIGTSYCYEFSRPHPQTQQMHKHYSFIVVVEDNEAHTPATPYLATYTMNLEGICYHRCLQKKSYSELFNAVARGQVHNLIEFPTLQQSVSQNAKLRAEEIDQKMVLDPVFGIVTVKDKKHNVTFKILPRT